jgi:RNA-binding protein
MPLTGKQRHHLRALAHHLDPVVQIGHDGVTGAVVAQIDAALAAHELIKVRLGAECPMSRDEAAEAIAAGAHAEVAQIIGRVVVVFRRRPKKAKVPLTPGKRTQAGSKGRRPAARAKAKSKTATARAAKRRKREARRAPRRAVV